VRVLANASGPVTKIAFTRLGISYGHFALTRKQMQLLPVVRLVIISPHIVHIMIVS
jgi:hypothetical protein